MLTGCNAKALQQWFSCGGGARAIVPPKKHRTLTREPQVQDLFMIINHLQPTDG